MVSSVRCASVTGHGSGAWRAFSNASNKPGVESARIRSMSAGSFEPLRQNSGIRWSARMPTETGHDTAAVVIPRSRAASISVGTRMPRAYQYHAPLLRSSGSRISLPKMPCTAGVTPVMSDVCDA